MPHTNRGNPHSARYDFRNTPGIDSTPVAHKRREVVFVPSTLSGPIKVTAGGVEYNIPTHAVAKYRRGIVWLLIGDRCHVLTAKGEVLLSDHDQRKFAQGWRSI